MASGTVVIHWCPHSITVYYLSCIMYRVRSAALIFLALACTMACRKQEVDPSGSGVSADPAGHIELATDSACIQAPNVITPNFDGINDLFVVHGRNMTSLAVEVRDPQGIIVFASEDPAPTWDAADTTGNGPYTVHVSGITSSGATLNGHSSLHALDYNGAACLNYNGIPVTPDQLDPRICGVSYTSNDIFCE